MAFLKRGGRANRGFALGLILLVIALMAVVTAALSISSRGNMQFVDTDKARGYANSVRSQAGTIRDAILSMRLQGISMQSIDRSWDCAVGNCLREKIDGRKILGDAFNATPASEIVSFQYWASDLSASFKGISLDTYVLRFPIKGEICAAVQSLNSGRPQSINDIPVFDSLIFSNGGATVDLNSSVQLSALDGCFRADANARMAYYYFIIGKGCGGSLGEKDYWPCP
jgi:hypothetical protein